MKYGVTMLMILNSRMTIREWLQEHFDDAETLLKVDARHLREDAYWLLHHASKGKRNLRKHIMKDIATGKYRMKNGKTCCIPHGISGGCIHCATSRAEQALHLQVAAAAGQTFTAPEHMSFMFKHNGNYVLLWDEEMTFEPGTQLTDIKVKYAPKRSVIGDSGWGYQR